MAKLSIRAYANHRGVTEAAVRRAIEYERITVSPDGLIDPEVADKEWDERRIMMSSYYLLDSL